MSLISASRSVPALWIVAADVDLLVAEVAGLVRASTFDRISSEFSGVRSSCDMFARNSDLYFELSASCSAFSSSELRAISISRFLISMSRFWRSSSCGLLLQLLVGLLELLLLGLERLGLLLELLRLRLRLLEQLLGADVGDDRGEHHADRLRELVEELQDDLAERPERGQLDHREHLLLEEHRDHDDVARRRLAEARRDRARSPAAGR